MVNSNERAVPIDGTNPHLMHTVEIRKMLRRAIMRPAKNGDFGAARLQAKINAKRRKKLIGPGSGNHNDNGSHNRPLCCFYTSYTFTFSLDTRDSGIQQELHATLLRSLLKGEGCRIGVGKAGLRFIDHMSHVIHGQRW